MIWVIGSQGMLGRELVSELEKQDLPFCTTDLDVNITDIAALRDFADGKEIDWIINAAAYTAVDKAESEENSAQAVNGLGPGCIGRIAHEIDATVIHFSTDYVFDGQQEDPYVETDPVNPLSAYGRTKLAGELALLEATDKFFIFRISWLYGQFGGNFVTTMLKLFRERTQLGIVADQYGAPTWTKTLSENIAKMLSHFKPESTNYGVYHYSDEGLISWYDFACAIYEKARLKKLLENEVKLEAISTLEYPTPAHRPANSSFDKTKVKQLGFAVNPWRENLQQYLESLVNEVKS